MKLAILILAFASSCFAAPKPSKLFYDHFEDFIELIVKEAGQDLELLLQQYVKYNEFSESIDYMQTTDFMDAVTGIESLPEYKAVVHYLEEDDIDIIYFIDLLNQLLGTISIKNGVHRQSGGKNVTTCMKDSIELFPKAKLTALFDHKMANHKEFKATIDKLRSKEWRHTLNALWTNTTFRTISSAVDKHGINVAVLVKEIVAVFGQN